jgi:hypothetical protein
VAPAASVSASLSPPVRAVHIRLDKAAADALLSHGGQLVGTTRDGLVHGDLQRKRVTAIVDPARFVGEHRLKAFEGQLVVVAEPTATRSSFLRQRGANAYIAIPAATYDAWVAQAAGSTSFAVSWSPHQGFKVNL